MNTFTTTLVSRLSDKHLLKHRFYQAWDDGSLPRSSIQEYATQYYHHVKAFPRYLSATHSQCENLEWRQFLLENLIDEERGSENHPELWTRFAEGMGVSREELKYSKISPNVQELIDTFMGLARSSFEEGLGALFAYEHQVPEIADFKMRALENHYQVSNPSTLSFFEVHRNTDVYHTQTLGEILEQLPEPARLRAEQAARTAANALWKFLDGIPTPESCH